MVLRLKELVQAFVDVSDGQFDALADRRFDVVRSVDLKLLDGTDDHCVHLDVLLLR
jgi:hypothetical protein